jgi:hypothetical protein
VHGLRRVAIIHVRKRHKTAELGESPPFLTGEERAMQSCEIYHVPYNDSFAWKWRHISQDGRVTESKQAYALYYECVCAARESGFEPKLKRQ